MVGPLISAARLRINAAMQRAPRALTILQLDRPEAGRLNGSLKTAPSARAMTPG
ncbi:hypothetical protein Q3A80_20990 [Burkholderia sp. SR8]|jgi:hypothetical protein|uniref:hypothetical protein n=1 Tax=Burkholderia sp. SR8 TaxID=3062277 RepID=UPI004062BEFE